MASMHYQNDRGTYRVKWRVEGKQDAITVPDKRTAEMLVKWLDRNGVKPSTDPDLLYAIGRQPVSVAADPVTVAEALDAMIARPLTAHGRPMTEGTRKKYRSDKNRLEPLHAMTVTGLSRADVDAFMAPLIAKRAEATWRGVAITLQTALRPHGRAELCKGYAKRTPPGARKRPPVVMSRAQMDLMVTLGHDHGIGRFLALLAGLGVRFGEAAAIERDHCSFRGVDGPEVSIVNQYPATSRARGVEPEPDELKSLAARRTLSLSPALAEWIEPLGPGLLTVDGYDGHGPWRHKTFSYRLARTCQDAIAEGIIDRPVHAHDFRHSWGAHLLNGGADPVTVSQLMGHASIATTGRHYGHLTLAGRSKVRDLLK
jgi:integrase